MLGSWFGRSPSDEYDEEDLDDDLDDDLELEEDEGPGTLAIALVATMIALPVGMLVGRTLERRRSVERELRARSLGRGTGSVPEPRLRTVYPPGWEDEHGHDAGPGPDESGDDYVVIPAHTIEP